MVIQGVIQGTGSNKLSPKGMASRAQVATMLMRYNAAEQELLRQTISAARMAEKVLFIVMFPFVSAPWERFFAYLIIVPHNGFSVNPHGSSPHGQLK